MAREPGPVEDRSEQIKGNCNATDGFSVCTNPLTCKGPHWDRRTQHEWAEEPDPSCPDGGTCHHSCKLECFRVACCGPLSGVFPGDAWPREIVSNPQPVVTDG